MNQPIQLSLLIRVRRLAVIGLVASLAACAGSEGQRRVWGDDDPGVLVVPPGTTPPPRSAQPEPVPAVGEGGAANPLPAYPRSAEEISGAAVTSLMRQARTALDAGQPAQAAAALERALRIEPRNYFVWSLLGKSYLAQQNFSQADNVAGKSNALARGNLYVELENWKTIATARDAMGDQAGADVAQQRLQALQQRLDGAAPR
ncbi:MAG TPA: tetratricopeptide repeat protein [Fontimonas sp.]